MPKPKSAGLLMYRIRSGELEVLLVHPGGPYWTKKDQWFVPKGEIEPGEDEFAAAQREFQEETGIAPAGPFIDLGEIANKSGKLVHAWAFAGDCDPAAIVSNTFSMEWPPKSGCTQQFPEIDRAAFMTVEGARTKMSEAEFEFVRRLKKGLETEAPAREGN
jgi:predicted NUDIX family NTP pyrophosphohydrolase